MYWIQEIQSTNPCYTEGFWVLHPRTSLPRMDYRDCPRCALSGWTTVRLPSRMEGSPGFASDISKMAAYHSQAVALFVALHCIHTKPNKSETHTERNKSTSISRQDFWPLSRALENTVSYKRKECEWRNFHSLKYTYSLMRWESNLSETKTKETNSRLFCLTQNWTDYFDTSGL